MKAVSQTCENVRYMNSKLREITVNPYVEASVQEIVSGLRYYMMNRL